MSRAPQGPFRMVVGLEVANGGQADSACGPIRLRRMVAPQWAPLAVASIEKSAVASQWRGGNRSPTTGTNDLALIRGTAYVRLPWPCHTAPASWLKLSLSRQTSRLLRKHVRRVLAGPPCLHRLLPADQSNHLQPHPTMALTKVNGERIEPLRFPWSWVSTKPLGAEGSSLPLPDGFQ